MRRQVQRCGRGECWPADTVANRSGQSVRRCATSGAAGEAAGSTDRATTAKPEGMLGRVVSDLVTTSRHCVSSNFIATTVGSAGSSPVPQRLRHNTALTNTAPRDTVPARSRRSRGAGMPYVNSYANSFIRAFNSRGTKRNDRNAESYFDFIGRLRSTRIWWAQM